MGVASISSYKSHNFSQPPVGLGKKEQVVLWRGEQVPFIEVFRPWNGERRERGTAGRGAEGRWGHSLVAGEQLPSSSISAPVV